jgi:hypothetical protein
MSRRFLLPPWLRRVLLRLRLLPSVPPAALSDRERAQALVRAIDAGGLPLNPARVNQIARALGLEVSAHAPVAQTVERIRAALARMGPG